MVELSDIKQGQLVADLGSGDGRIAIAMAEKGGIVTGFELDQELFLSSQQTIKDKKLENNIQIVNKDFWDTDFAKFEILCIYPMPDIMPALWEKIAKECRSGTKIVTNYYTFENEKWISAKNKIYLYITT
jgi:16S rRNA A1518/A1519 N6-dimethyltransferase RsmA/KsgA/DIM1 with predicted DNA glycosylase/AP lyase activity